MKYLENLKKEYSETLKELRKRGLFSIAEVIEEREFINEVKEGDFILFIVKRDIYSALLREWCKTLWTRRTEWKEEGIEEYILSMERNILNYATSEELQKIDSLCNLTKKLKDFIVDV